MPHRVYVIFLAIFAGVLLGIGSRFSPLWECSLLSFALVGYVLARVQSMRFAFLCSFIVGICAYGLSFHSLFWDSLPLTWLGVNGWSGVFLIVVVWTITVLLFALIFALVFAVVWRFVSLRNWTDMLIVPSAYVLAEWLSTWGFSIVNFGPFSLWGPHFTMGSPSYQLASDAALLQCAWFGGIYMLGFVQALCGVAVYRLIVAKRVREKSIIAVFFALLALYCVIADSWLSHPPSPENGTALRVAIVNIYQPSILAPTNNELNVAYKKMSGLISSIASSSVSIIGLPEDSRFLQQWHEENPSGFSVPFETGGTHATVIDSASEHEEDGALYSRTEYFDPIDNTSVYSYKQFLMPLGEEHPYLYQVVVRLIGQGGLVDSLLTVRGFHTQPYVRQAVINGVSVAALLCSEGMSPSLYADQARKGAQVFFNLASHAWFHGSHTMHTLAQWNGRVRAVESRRWYARPADDSPAFILDPYGRVRAIMPWNTEGVLYGTIYARTDVTPYMIFGQWILILPCVILLYASLKRREQFLQRKAK